MKNNFLPAFLPSFLGKDWTLPGNLVGFGLHVEHLKFYLLVSDPFLYLYFCLRTQHSLAGEITGLIKLCYMAMVKLMNLVNLVNLSNICLKFLVYIGIKILFPS